MKNKGVFSAAILTAVLCISGNLWAYSGLGDGSSGNPYQIADVNNFQQLSATPTDWSKSFILTANIDLTGLTFTQAPIAPDTDSAIEDFQGTQFTGVFDGNGHVIGYLTITAPTKDYVGLFGYIGSSGKIKNLGVKNATITGRYYVGGLVGYNNDGGTLTACYATGSVTGSYYVGGLVGCNDNGTLTGCHATGSVTGTYYVGGLVGWNQGSLTSCYATGSVSGTNFVGGLVGENYYATITSCYATGSVYGTYDVGGLVGENYYATITSCYATGSVTGTGDFVGGLVGDNYSGTITDCYATGSVTGNWDVGGLVGINQGSLTSCYATGSVTGTSFVGGLVGDNSGTLTGCFWDMQTSGQPTSAGGTGKTTAEMKQINTFANWDFVETWGIEDNQTYPFLTLTYPTGDLNHDKVVDFYDFAIFANHWLEGT